jgi:ribonuclease P protein component
MSLKILSIQKSSEFTKVNKIAKKFIVSNFIILTAPTPKDYIKNNLVVEENVNYPISSIKENIKKISQNSLLNNNKIIINNGEKSNKKFVKQQFFIEDFCRVGYTVSKNVSKLANRRNLIKRYLREAFLANNKYLNKHQDYIIIARNNILQAQYQQIIRDLTFALKRLNNDFKNIKK